MFHTLIVPLDGSELAERALPYAMHLAAAARGEIILVRVALAPAPMTIEAADFERMQRIALGEAESYLARIAATTPPQVSVKTVVLYGRVARRLIETVHEFGADAVVMATHGRTGLPHLLYGSVAEALLAQSPVPVLLVHARPGEAPVDAFDPAYARVVVPLDGSSFAEAALEPAADLVGTTGELILTCVVEPPAKVERDETGHVIAYLDQQEEATTREARDYMLEVARQLEQSHPGIRTRADVRLGEPAAGITMSVIDRTADLVVMATHGRTGLSRALVGSVAGAVLRDGNAPVLLVGPHEAHVAERVLSAHAAAV